MIPVPPVHLLAENSLFHSIGELFHPIFVAIAYVLAAIYSVVPNYAISIALLTILIMLILTPLTVKSTKSMMAMQRLQPEIKKLQQKYKGAENREQLNREMMALYKEQGVNPAGSCLPMFLQFPFLIVLYDVIEGLANKTGAHAMPRYIPHHGTLGLMYQHLVESGGKMMSFGMDFSLKPFSHHANWYDYIPYFIILALAVGLQYLQMAQMTRRNPAAAQTNSQMQKIQKVMPIFFAYIYFLIPSAVVIYMIVSSLIRIITQDIMFRMGMVGAGAGGGQRRLGDGKSSGDRKRVVEAASTVVEGKSANGSRAGPKGRAGLSSGAPSKGGSKGAGGARPPGRRPSGAGAAREGEGGPKPRPRGAKAEGAGAKAPARNGAAPKDRVRQGAGTASRSSAAKPPTSHPRSKSKRPRKAR